MRNPQLMLWLAFSFFQLRYAFVAYDCGYPSMNMTTLSLLDIENCQFAPSVPVMKNVEIQLLQIKEFSKVKVIQCKIQIQRSIFYCGMLHHLFGVPNGNMDYMKELTHDQCKLLHDTGVYVLNGKPITNIELNKTTVMSMDFVGKFKEGGYCETGTYSDPYGTWNNAVVTGQITISAYEYYATVELERNEMILRSGLRCKYTEAKCMDTEGGHTYWNLLPKDSCNTHKFSLLFEGSAKRIKDYTHEKYGEEIYSVNQGAVTFALATRGYLPNCGTRLVRTEHPKLFILDRTISEFMIKKEFFETIDLENMDLFAYVNAKFVYFEKHLRGQLISMYNDVIKQECELERTVLYNALSIAPLSPADFAYQFMREPGYIAHLSGEVIKIAKCLAVDVKRRDTPECYQELPITRNNESYFMLPRTHIIVKSGTQIDCNPLLAPMYRIQGKWYELNPKPSPGNEPTRLIAQTKLSWNYTMPNDLATGGIYSEEDLDSLRRNIMFPLERPAVVNTIVRGARGHSVSDSSITLNSLIDKIAIKKTIEKAWGKVYNFFNRVGTYSVTFFGAYLTFRLVKFVIDTIVHGFALHSAYGWSLCLLGALWDSITNLLLHLRRKRKEDKDKGKDKEEMKPLADIDTNKYRFGTYFSEKDSFPSYRPFKQPDYSIYATPRPARKVTFADLHFSNPNLIVADKNNSQAEEKLINGSNSPDDNKSEEP